MNPSDELETIDRYAQLGVDKLAAFQLGLVAEADRLGIGADQLPFFLKISQQVAVGQIKTASQLHAQVDELALDLIKESEEKDKSGVQAGEALLHAGGGALAGSSIAYLLHKLRQLVTFDGSSAREERAKRNKAMLVGGLLGAGVGTGAYYTSKGEASPLPTTMDMPLSKG